MVKAILVRHKKNRTPIKIIIPKDDEVDRIIKEESENKAPNHTILRANLLPETISKIKESIQKSKIRKKSADKRYRHKYADRVRQKKHEYYIQNKYRIAKQRQQYYQENKNEIELKRKIKKTEQRLEQVLRV